MVRVTVACEMRTTLGTCWVGLNNQDTDVKDDLSRGVGDGMDGDLGQEFSRGEVGSSSDQCDLPCFQLHRRNARRTGQGLAPC